MEKCGTLLAPFITRCPPISRCLGMRAHLVSASLALNLLGWVTPFQTYHRQMSSPFISRRGGNSLRPQCVMIRSNVWRYIDKALKDGYTIVQKALLLSSPNPTAENIPKFRTTFVVVEAALTCIFGAFRHPEKGFGDLCPWSQDLFEWTGLCSHIPTSRSSTWRPEDKS